MKLREKSVRPSKGLLFCFFSILIIRIVMCVNQFWPVFFLNFGPIFLPEIIIIKLFNLDIFIFVLADRKKINASRSTIPTSYTKWFDTDWWSRLIARKSLLIKVSP